MNSFGLTEVDQTFLHQCGMVEELNDASEKYEYLCLLILCCGGFPAIFFFVVAVIRWEPKLNTYKEIKPPT